MAMRIELLRGDTITVAWENLSEDFMEEICVHQSLRLVDAYNFEIGISDWRRLPLPKTHEEVMYFNAIMNVVHPVVPSPPPASIAEYRAQLRVNSRIPPIVAERAYDYQIEGISRGIEWNGRMLLADEMGLGKTVQAIGIACHFTDFARGERMLICCPASLADNWVREVGKWTADRREGPLRVRRIEKGDEDVDTASFDCLVVSYSLVGEFGHAMYRRLVRGGPGATHSDPPIVPPPWKTMICDESHYFQTHDSQRSECLLPLMERVPHLVLLSGTPQLARPAQLYVQFKALYANTDLGRLTNWKQFTARWCDGHYHEFYRERGTSRPLWVTTGKSREYELCRVLNARTLRRYAEIVQRDLPPRTRHQITTNIPVAEAKVFAIVRREWDVAVAAFKELGDDQIHAKNVLGTKLEILKMKMWHATAPAKASSACDYVETVVAEEREKETKGERWGKVLVFAHHETMRSALRERMKEKEIEYVEIGGDTPANKRQALVDRVARRDSPTRVCVASITACAAGLNFTPGVTRIIFAEFHFTPSLHLQAECRAHRVGCDSPVRVDYLIALGTLDAEMMDVNRDKFAVNDEIVDDGRNFAGFDVDERMRVSFAGHEVEPYGIQARGREVRVLPAENESIEAFLRRACVTVNEEWANEWLESAERFPRLHDTNVLHAAKGNGAGETGGFVNLAEWDWERFGSPGEIESYHALPSETSAEECERLRTVTEFERAERLRERGACALFARRKPRTSSSSSSSSSSNKRGRR